MQETFIQGSYLQSYLRIYINTNLSFERFEDLHDYEKRVFIHEYTHFLQNIMGVFGFSHIWHTLDSTRQIIPCLQKIDKNEIIIPVENQIHEKEMILAKIINAIRGGHSVAKGMDDHTTIIRGINYYSDPDFSVLYPFEESQFLVLLLEDSNGMSMDYRFGEVAVTETMALLMESKFYETDPANNFPYHVCLLLGRYLETDIVENEELLFALCDVATLWQYPGNAFYRILLQMKEEAFQPNKGEDVIEYGIKFMYRQGWQIWEEYNKTKKGALIVLNEMFRHSVFAETVRWFEYIIELGFTSRKCNPNVILKLYKEKEPFTGTWLDVLKNFGAPQLKNAKNERFVWPPVELAVLRDKIEPEYLLAFQEIHDTMLYGNSACRLYDTCCLSKNGLVVDSRCKHAPWERAQDEMGCAYAALWLAFGLKDKKVNSKLI